MQPGENVESYVEKNYGVRPEHIDDGLYFHYDRDRDEKTYVRLDAFMSQLEDDLSQMPKRETILSPEKHSEIVVGAYKDTLKNLGAYIPYERVQQLFPGIDLNNINDYDFKNARVHTVILQKDDFALVREALEEKAEGGFTAQQEDYTIVDYQTKRINLNVATKSLLVIEDDPTAQHLREVTVHELEHALNVGYRLPDPLREGVVEWYRCAVTAQIDETNFTLNSHRKIEVEIADKVIHDLLESGLPMHEINQILLRTNTQDMEILKQKLSKKYDIYTMAGLLTAGTTNEASSTFLLNDLKSK